MPTIFQTFDRSGKPHRNWRFKYINYKGERKTATGLPTKEQTKKLANKIQTEQDEIRKGLRPPPKEAEIPRPFDAVVAEYISWGEAQGGHGGRPWGADHLRMRRRHLKFWPQRLAVEVLPDLIGILPKVEAVLREIQSAGRAGKTVQNYAESLAAFCDWAIDRGYLDHDPLKNLEPFDTTARSTRRAPTTDEIRAILTVASPERRLLYEVALTTGLRANELRSVEVRHLDVQNGGLKLEAVWTKGRKATFQPLPSFLVAKLGAVAVGKAPSDRLLSVPYSAAGALYRDMNAAGVAKVTADGKLDFHALRTGFTTYLFEADASVKEAQSLARHSTPDLTLNVYARTRSARLAGIVQAVGDKILAATGCPIGVQQPTPSMAPVAASDAAASDCGNSNAPTAGGSTPPETSIADDAEVGHQASIDGLELTQDGHQKEVVHSELAASRTAPQAAADDCGQRGCTTDVHQRILAASGIYGFSGFARAA